MKVAVVSSDRDQCGIQQWTTLVGLTQEKAEARIRVLPNGCWLWLGVITRYGYPQWMWQKRTHRAHRLVYQALRGPIPEGLTIDHLCRNKACVNPDHLEPVTVRVNTLRGTGFAAINARKTHCRLGHPLEGENLRLKHGPHGVLRTCRTCAKVEAKRRHRVWMQVHPRTNRSNHWLHKDPCCPHCTQFFVELEACA